MINKSTLVSALPLSLKFAEAGKTLVAKPNTLISELTRHSMPVHELAIENQEQMDGYFELVEMTTTGSLNDPGQHSLEMDAALDDLSKHVSAHISFAKNIVKPTVVEFAEHITRHLEENSKKDPAAKFDIKTLNMPGVLKDGFFLDSLSFYKESNPLKPDVKFSLAEKTRDEIVAILLTGEKKTDALIGEWIAQQEDSFLNLVWTSFFTAHGDARSIISFDALDRLNVFEKTDHVLAIYLLARKLFEQVDESASEMSLSSYKRIAAQYRDYAGSMLSGCVKKLALFVKTNTLVIENRSDIYQAKVNGEVYRTWLNDGGSPEVILGLIVSGEQIATRALIDAKATELLSRWSSYCSFSKTDDANKAFGQFKDFLTAKFGLSLNTLAEEERAYVEANPGYYSTVKKLLETEIESLRSTDMTDPYCVALKLIGKCRFYYTSAYEILDDINEAARVNPDIDVREAALLAVINYLADYVADQIAVSA